MSVFAEIGMPARNCRRTIVPQGGTEPLSRWPDPVFHSNGVPGWFGCLFGARCQLLFHSDRTRGRFSQLLVRLRPHEASPWIRHLSQDVILNLLHGVIVLEADGEPVRLSTGDAAALPRDTRYRWHSDYSGAALLLTISPGGVEQMLQACSNVVSADVVDIARTYGTEILYAEAP